MHFIRNKHVEDNLEAVSLISKKIFNFVLNSIGFKWTCGGWILQIMKRIWQALWHGFKIQGGNREWDV